MDSLWIDFVNSDRRDYTGRGRHEDRLDQEPWLRSLLARHDLEPVNVRSRAAREALRGLRALLRRLVTSISEGRRIGDRDLAALNAYLAEGSIVSRLERRGDSFRVSLEPARHGLPGVLFRIASSFAGFLVEADPGRLKVCDNPDCQWVFYDRSRSRTRRWCDDGCGNLLKVRRFRARKGRG
jgi:predicted RNA-binding Zn ribbon-like protein